MNGVVTRIDSLAWTTAGIETSTINRSSRELWQAVERRVLEYGSLNAIVSVAALHHLDFAAALARTSQLLCRGGVFVAIGLAKSSAADLPRDVIGFAASSFLRAARSKWEHSSPILWPPPMTYAEVRSQAAKLLPGVVYRRHLLFRYSLTWTQR